MAAKAKGADRVSTEVQRQRRAHNITTLSALFRQEHDAIQRALEVATKILPTTRGVYSLTAKLLGIDRSRLRRKMLVHRLVGPADDEI